MYTDYIKKIIYYCLGSPLFKQNNKESFIKSINLVNKNILFEKFFKADMVGLLYDSLYDLPIFDDKLFVHLENYIKIQNLYNNILINEMANIGNDLKRLQINPIILKGPALWEHIYKNKSIRKVKDLDILITSIKDIKKCNDYFKNHNYSSNELNTEKYIESNKSYELYPYYKKVTFELNPTMVKTINWIIKQNINQPRITKYGLTKYSFSIEIELHKSIFLLNQNKYVEVKNKDLEKWLINNSFMVLKKQACIPYLCTKFSHDVSFKKNKCIKLTTDIINILINCNQSEIDKSIEYAEKWSSVKYYLDVLSSISFLMPEVQMSGLPERSYNPLDIIVNKIINDRTDRVNS